MNALLIAAQTKDDFYDLSYQLDELRALVETIDIKVAYTLTQKVDKINPATYIGIGKLQEAKNICLAYDIDVCIFNDELSPSQMRNVKDIINCDVYDRSYVVLKIFELRAQTKEAKLEVKLAKDYYLLPRTDQFKTERVSGASNVTRGKGESESELDKRRISNEIVQIKKQIAEINKMQDTQIINRKKNDIPIVALVGYTNAGKSSTMNTILNYCEQSEDKHVDVEELRPNGMMLGYPVITSGEYAHTGSIENLIGTAADYESEDRYRQMLDDISLEKHVNKDVPPAFIWGTAEDGSVHPMNSVLLVEALMRENIPVEYHLFRKGGHGLSLGDERTISAMPESALNDGGNINFQAAKEYVPSTSAWVSMAATWIRGLH
jgi:hypothetical protein